MAVSLYFTVSLVRLVSRSNIFESPQTWLSDLGAEGHVKIFYLLRKRRREVVVDILRIGMRLKKMRIISNFSFEFAAVKTASRKGKLYAMDSLNNQLADFTTFKGC